MSQSTYKEGEFASPCHAQLIQPKFSLLHSAYASHWSSGGLHPIVSALLGKFLPAPVTGTETPIPPRARCSNPPQTASPQSRLPTYRAPLPHTAPAQFRGFDRASGNFQGGPDSIFLAPVGYPRDLPPRDLKVRALGKKVFWADQKSIPGAEC